MPGTIKITGGIITWREYGRQLALGALEGYKLSKGETAESLMRGLASLLALHPPDLEGIIKDAGIEIEAEPGTKIE